MSGISKLKEFSNIMANHPEQAYDFIANNYWEMEKSMLADIIKELLYAIRQDCYASQVKEVCGDVAMEIDEQYKERYEEGE